MTVWSWVFPYLIVITEVEKRQTYKRLHEKISQKWSPLNLKLFYELQGLNSTQHRKCVVNNAHINSVLTQMGVIHNHSLYKLK